MRLAAACSWAQASPIGFIGLSVDVPGTMLGNGILSAIPGGAGVVLFSCVCAGGVENRLPSGSAIDIGPGIAWIAQDVVDGRVALPLDPADFGVGVHLQGNQSFRSGTKARPVAPIPSRRSGG